MTPSGESVGILIVNFVSPDRPVIEPRENYRQSHSSHESECSDVALVVCGTFIGYLSSDQTLLISHAKPMFSLETFSEFIVALRIGFNRAHANADENQLMGANFTARDEKRICVISSIDLSVYEHGGHPSRWPYGVDQLQRAGNYSVFQPAPAWSRRFKNLVPKIRASGARDLFEAHVLPGLELRSAVNRADVVLSLFEDQAEAYRQCARRRPMPPLVVMSCWLAQNALGNDGWKSARLAEICGLSTAITVFSENQVPVVATTFGVKRSKLHVLTFGVETEFYTPEGEDEEYVAVAGNDNGRDWPSFIACALSTPNIRYRVASTRRITDGELPANVTNLGALDQTDYRELMRHASFVLVPSHPLAYPTGQSVLLEGFACGRAGVVARSPAMRDYAVPEASMTYEPGNSDSMASAVNELTRDAQRRHEMGSAARRIAEARFSSRRMWTDVGDLLSGTT